MRYMLLIYEDEQRAAARNEQERAAEFQGHLTFLGELTMFGKHVHSEGLEPSTTATVVRVQDGKTLMTDGPFAETKEMIAGFYIIEADDLDEAIAWAAKVPAPTAATLPTSTAATVTVIVSRFGSPYVQSINRTTPAGPLADTSSVIYTVNFSEAVLHVAARSNNGTSFPVWIRG
jgi:hypothetical protein